MKCPQCGYQPPRGAPKKFDHEKAKAMRKKGLSYRAIAEKLGVTDGAVRAALKHA